MTATRRQAREWAIQMITAADLNPPSDIPQFIASFWEEIASLDENEGRAEARGKLKAFAEERVVGVLANIKEIDGILASLLDNWDLYRLGTVERSVLRMGIWEMKFSDVPPPVVINEAVDLVNWFSSPKSRTLVNGVLDKFAKK
jgi:N utilization substance protein B